VVLARLRADGVAGADLGVEFLLAWIAVVFVSLLVHELGHAVAFRRFGSGADIVLYAFYGLAIPTHDVYGRGPRILIALAGPFAGFLLAAAVYGSNAAYPWAGAAGC
jgi:Zn-dependent protease